MEIKKFENSLIAFDFDSEMVNATDMLRNFPNKNIGGFLRLKQTKEYIKILESDVLNHTSGDNQALKIIKGNFNGNTQGTWMCKMLAYKFASWLSPEFELFVYSVFDNAINEKLRTQQMQLDYFWDKEDQRDLYTKK